MPEYLIQMAISLVLAMVAESIKNPASKARWKAALYKIWFAIGNLYPDFFPAKADGVEKWSAQAEKEFNPESKGAA